MSGCLHAIGAQPVRFASVFEACLALVSWRGEGHYHGWDASETERQSYGSDTLTHRWVTQPAGCRTGLRQPHQLGAVRLWRPQRLLLLVHLAERAVDAGRRCRRQAEPLDGATDGVVVVRRRLGLGRRLGLPPPLRLHRPPLYRAPDAARRARQPGQAAGLERARRVAGRQLVACGVNSVSSHLWL